MDVFVARQPIFDRFRRTFAYELLFRASAATNGYDGADPSRDSLRILDISLFLLGLETITGGKRAFVNFTRDILVNGCASIIPQDSIVVEILEDVAPDAEVIEACRRLKTAGHVLALDDFVAGASYEEFLEVADIVKVDFAQNSPAARAALVERLRPRGIKLLAEKVETEDEFAQALAAGYHYFQGYFFSKPVILSGKDIPASKLNLLQLLREIHRVEADFARIEEVIKREVGLTFKLLAYMNRTAFGFRREIETVQQALMLLGELGIKKWATVVALSDLGLDKPFEVVVNSVLRARFGELVAQRIGLHDRAYEAFLMGLLSLIDVLLGRPLAEILGTLPIADEVRQALLGAPNRPGMIHRLVLAYERGDWGEVSALASELGLNERAIPEIYVDAIEWGNSTASITGER
jgi:c-di-GMP-related signal transduction protein